jgi:hypothetical protein
VASDWEERAARAIARHDDGAARLPEDRDERQRQLTRMGNAAWAAGLAFLMAGRAEEASAWLTRAAERYRESWPLAPPGSWGRPIGAMKSRLIAGDLAGARADAMWALEEGASESESPIGIYAGVLARLVLGADAEARSPADALGERDDFPRPVADVLVPLAAGDAAVYGPAIRSLVANFESREEFLEDTPVADTVLALQVLAAERGMDVPLVSAVLPP